MLEKENVKRKDGITLISLVITIIILLILAGVAITLAVDSNGLFNRAGAAANKWNTSVGNEENKMNELLGILEQQVPDYQPMVTKWNVASGEEVKIYVYSTSNYIYDENGDPQEIPLENTTDLEIDWGDGTVEHYTKDNLNYDENGEGYITHTYGAGNISPTSTYEVKIMGSCNTIDMSKIIREAGIWENENLTSIEDWGNTGSIIYSFHGCISLSSIASPRANTFKNVTDFVQTFYGCESLTSIPEGLFANCPNVTSFEGTFERCSSLSSIPEGLFANCPNVTNFVSTFSDCTSLSSIPEGLFANCPNVTSFGSTFSNCTSLSSIPEDLFANCLNIANFICTFSGCTNLTGETIIPIWENYPETLTEENGYEGIPDGEGCYSNCNFTPEEELQIPEYWRYYSIPN